MTTRKYPNSQAVLQRRRKYLHTRSRVWCGSEAGVRKLRNNDQQGVYSVNVRFLLLKTACKTRDTSRNMNDTTNQDHHIDWSIIKGTETKVHGRGSELEGGTRWLHAIYYLAESGNVRVPWTVK